MIMVQFGMFKNHQKLNEKTEKKKIWQIGIQLTDSNTTVDVVVDSVMDVIVEVSVD